jgi:hypothetical protein
MEPKLIVTKEQLAKGVYRFGLTGPIGRYCFTGVRPLPDGTFEVDNPGAANDRVFHPARAAPCLN